MAQIFLDGPEAVFMSFVSVGETANLARGQHVAFDTSVGWPLVHNLRDTSVAHGGNYHGHYGNIIGQLVVQRSFMVPGGQVPAVAIVVGAVGGLSMQAGVRLTFLQDSSIAPVESAPDRMAYHYLPDMVLAPPD